MMGGAGEVVGAGLSFVRPLAVFGVEAEVYSLHSQVGFQPYSRSQQHQPTSPVIDSVWAPQLAAPASSFLTLPHQPPLAGQRSHWLREQAKP